MRLRNSVADWRRKRRLSRDALAKRAGIAWLTLQRIEDGKTAATNHLVMEKLARALGTSKDELFWAEESANGHGASGSPARSTTKTAGLAQ